MRVLLTVMVSILAGIAATWFGEDPEFPLVPFGIRPFEEYSVPILLLVCPVVCGAAAWYSAGRGRKVLRVLAVTVAVVLPLGGFAVGDRSFNRALNSCVEDSNFVRAALEQHRARHGTYPAELGNLDVDIPCRTPLRGTILRYRRTPNGYSLCFHDWLMGWCGDQERELAPHK